jgi:glycosyltransferase involved in cell wall biosynthesis
MPPTVSVIIATYNRSNILSFTIESALNQTHRDLELIVVGDACTDDTAEMVAGFSDPRLQYYNRPTNHGEQSIPNNDGVGRSKGEFLAFLNHDDLWFPDHLERALVALEEGQWDVVCMGLAEHRPDRKWHYRGPRETRPLLNRETSPASTWVMNSACFQRVGGFHDAREMRGAPSSEWLRRAKKIGCRIGYVPGVTVMAIPSGRRVNSYRNRDSDEARQASHFLKDGGREKLLELTLVEATQQLQQPTTADVLRSIYRCYLRDVYSAISNSVLGIIVTRPTHLRRGAYLNQLRKTRGLGPLPPHERPDQ